MGELSAATESQNYRHFSVLGQTGFDQGADVAASKISGRVWDLSRCPKGCREVQLAFDNAPSDDERVKLASGLRGHVWEALQCPNANHVLQKCISTMSPGAVQFIIDEIMSRKGALAKAAQHKFGCRIIQRLITHCEGEQLHALVNSLLSSARKLAVHVFGNYVLQQLLECGDHEQQERLMLLLERDVADLALDPYGSAVVSKALSVECAGERVSITRAVLQSPGLLAKMATSRHGHVGVKAILARAGAEQKLAVAQLTNESDALTTSRYGKLVGAQLN
jgi:hypothetical protein